MKKAAAIFLFLFAFVQAAPAVCALFDTDTYVFIADEEKGAEKSDDDLKKAKNVFTIFVVQADELAQKINTAFHVAEKIQPSPCMEKLTPPPNFC